MNIPIMIFIVSISVVITLFETNFRNHVISNIEKGGDFYTNINDEVSSATDIDS